MPAGTNTKPLLVTADMGYGHLRAAHSLADEIGTEVLRIDAPPLATEADVRRWDRARNLYERASRLSQVPMAGRPVRSLLEKATAIAPLHPPRDQSRPDRAVKTLDRMIDKGLGEALVARMKETGRPLLTTFYAPAILADRHGLDGVFCVATDTDLHRVWAPRDPARSRITYLVPTHRCARRLEAYGVSSDLIQITGFPLPRELADQTVLEKNLAARIVRLDPKGTFRARRAADLGLGSMLEEDPAEPPLVTYAVGGAGAQVALARTFLPALKEPLLAGRLRLALVAGMREEVAARLTGWVEKQGLADRVRVLLEREYADYYREFNRLLARTDILWTKPSELVFYAALGIPLVFAPPVGAQEYMNQSWLLHRGAALRQGEPKYAGHWIAEWLEEGVLAEAAWSGWFRMRNGGTERIRAAVF